MVGVPDETGATASWRASSRAPAGRASAPRSALRAFAKERLAPYKVPKQVVVMRELPRNAVGKVVKPELVKKLAG